MRIGREQCDSSSDNGIPEFGGGVLDEGCEVRELGVGEDG